MFNYVCILQSPNFVVTYHFFSDHMLLLTFVKLHIDHVFKIYRLTDLTELELFQAKVALEIENKNKPANVE